MVVLRMMFMHTGHVSSVLIEAALTWGRGELRGRGSAAGGRRRRWDGRTRTVLSLSATRGLRWMSYSVIPSTTVASSYSEAGLKPAAAADWRALISDVDVAGM